MTRSQFGQFVNLLSHWGMRVLDTAEMNELEAFIEHTDKVYVSEESVNELLEAMMRVYSGGKVDALKAYRAITNANLLNVKNAVERYAVGVPAKQD